MDKHDSADIRPDVVTDHRRQWRDCLYIYPVIARRSKGLSIGVNLNPDKRCNFACLYCQINRRIRRDLKGVDLSALRSELQLAIEAAVSGDLWREPRFAPSPPGMRRINDIATDTHREAALARISKALAERGFKLDESDKEQVR